MIIVRKKRAAMLITTEVKTYEYHYCEVLMNNDIDLNTSNVLSWWIIPGTENSDE